MIKFKIIKFELPMSSCPRCGVIGDGIYCDCCGYEC